jgi:hypothetical protein
VPFLVKGEAKKKVPRCHSPCGMLSSSRLKQENNPNLLIPPIMHSPHVSLRYEIAAPCLCANYDT